MFTNKYILVAYKISNGYMRDFKLLEQPISSKERLEYIANSNKYQSYKDNWYILTIFQDVEEIKGSWDEENYNKSSNNKHTKGNTRRT